MAYLLTNLIIIAGIYFYSSSFRHDTLSSKILSIIVLYTAQVVLTQLLLGTFHQLNLIALIILNITISGIFVFLSIQNKINFTDVIRQDIKKTVAKMKECFSLESLILVVLALIVCVWMVAAATLMPPRGVDDMVYHLPEIYQSIQAETVVLLPTEIRTHYAYPHNAELLFMWPLLFLKSVTVVGLVQFVFAWIGVLVSYALARFINVPVKISFFCALLFLFAPVVLAQAGSAYVDIITSVFFLLSLYFSLQYYDEKDKANLFLAAAAMGLMLGMKYSMLISIASLQLLIISTLWKHHRKLAWVYLGIIILTGGYWYIRNWIVFSTPLYPMNFADKSMGIFNVQGGLSPWEKIWQSGEKLHLLFSQDVGIGSFHGGFGMVFWGLALPSWIYCFGLALFKKDKHRYVLSIFWLQFLLGFLILFLVPLKQFDLYPRFSIFMVAIGFIALGVILERLKERFLYASFIKALCILFTGLSVIQLSLVTLPSYDVRRPVEDLIEGKDVSKFKYLRQSSFMLPMTFAWEGLDYITKDSEKGLSIYLKASAVDYWTAPLFGSSLQNRIWNFGPQDKEPDAFLFYNEKGAGEFSVGKTYTSKEVSVSDRYETFITTPGFSLLLSNSAFDRYKEDIRRFYEMYFSNKIQAFSSVLGQLNPNVPFVTNLDNGHVFKYYELNGQIDNEVTLLPVAAGAHYSDVKKLEKFYSLNNNVKGYKSRIAAKVNLPEKEVNIYEYSK